MIRFVLATLIELCFLGALGWIWFGRRPSPDQFAAAHGVALDDASLPPVRAALRRTYRGRVFGALLGAVVLGCIGLVIGVAAAVGAAFIGLVAGTMVGIALAQHRARPAPGTVRHASLDARTIPDYAPARARWSIGLTALACVAASVLVVVSAPAGLGPYGPAVALALATLLIIPLGSWLQRRIVEAPRDATDPTVDDALRSSAVRAVHHSVLGVLLCGLAVACVGGLLTHVNMTVTSNDRTVFTAPPGSTSISVDTGLRQAGNPNAPVRVYWIESDGSEHSQVLSVAADPVTNGVAPSALGGVFGWVFLVAAVAALVQWSRATSASRRGSRRSRSRRSAADTTGSFA